MHGMSDMERASERRVVRRKWSVGNGYAWNGCERWCMRHEGYKTRSGGTYNMSNRNIDMKVMGKWWDVFMGIWWIGIMKWVWMMGSWENGRWNVPYGHACMHHAQAGNANNKLSIKKHKCHQHIIPLGSSFGLCYSQHNNQEERHHVPLKKRSPSRLPWLGQ